MGGMKCVKKFSFKNHSRIPPMDPDLVFPAGVLERLRTVGLRPTEARVHIVLALEAAETPMTVSDVFRALIRRGVKVCLGTTYRTLVELAAVGVLLRTWVPGHYGTKATYTLKAAGLEARASHRLTCGRCGHSIAFMDPGLPERLCRAAGLHEPGEFRQPLTVTVACLGCSPTCATQGAPAHVERTKRHAD
jgi:Fe2+ or Zn2+ uptake regulation protein